MYKDYRKNFVPRLFFILTFFLITFMLNIWLGGHPWHQALSNAFFTTILAAIGIFFMPDLFLFPPIINLIKHFTNKNRNSSNQ